MLYPYWWMSLRFHEYAHIMCIRLTAKHHINAVPVYYSIRAFTNSEFYRILADRNTEPEIQMLIRINAASGFFLGDVSFFLLCLIIIMKVKLFSLLPGLLLCGIAEIIRFVSSSDFNYMLHPEDFQYKLEKGIPQHKQFLIVLFCCLGIIWVYNNDIRFLVDILANYIRNNPNLFLIICVLASITILPVVILFIWYTLRWLRTKR